MTGIQILILTGDCEVKIFSLFLLPNYWKLLFVFRTGTFAQTFMRSYFRYIYPGAHTPAHELPCILKVLGRSVLYFSNRGSSI